MSALALSPMVAEDTDRLSHRLVAHMRQIMARHGWSRYALAKKIGVSSSHLTRCFLGERGVGIDVFYALHTKLHIEADVLLHDDPPERFWRPLPDESRPGRRPQREMPDPPVPLRKAAR